MFLLVLMTLALACMHAKVIYLTFAAFDNLVWYLWPSVNKTKVATAAQKDLNRSN